MESWIIFCQVQTIYVNYILRKNHAYLSFTAQNKLYRGITVHVLPVRVFRLGTHILQGKGDQCGKKELFGQAKEQILVQ